MPFLIAALTFAVFLPSLRNGFVNWDDYENLLGNQNYRGLGWVQLKWMFTTFHLGPYQPLSWMTFGLDYLIWGMAPFGYHLTNVILHSINAVVFYLVCKKLLAAVIRPVLAAEKKTELAVSAGFAALFFALHPLRVESVAWVTERRDVLSGLFYLLALLWYISPRCPAVGPVPFWRRQLLPFAAFILALLSKGMVVSLPAALIVLDIYPLGRLPGEPRRWFSRETRRIWLEKIPFLALAAVFGVIGFIGQRTLAAGRPSQPDFGWHIVMAVPDYIWKTVVPLHLSPLYGFSVGGGSWLSRPLLLGLAIAAITAGAIVMRRRFPAWLAVWICYLAALVPTLGIIKLFPTVVADRYSYLSCLGFAVLAGGAFWTGSQTAGRRLRIVCSMLAGSIICGLIFLTVHQEKIWRDSQSLFLHALAVDSQYEYSHYQEGNDLALRYEPDEAVRQCLEAVSINPGFYEGYLKAGDILAEQGRTEEAAKYYREAMKIKPDSAVIQSNLGNVLDAQGKFDEAVEHYREALRLDPDYAEVRNNLGVALGNQGNTGQAILCYREALRLVPDFAKAHTNLGNALAVQGKFDEATEHFRAALRIRPDYAEAQNSLGSVLAIQGKLRQAVFHYHEALRLDPYLAEAHNNLGTALARQHKTAAAVLHYCEALRLDPDYVEARRNLYALVSIRS
jgi:tetratricopeptide (TPR) repeat protein